MFVTTKSVSIENSERNSATRLVTDVALNSGIFPCGKYEVSWVSPGRIDGRLADSDETGEPIIKDQHQTCPRQTKPCFLTSCNLACHDMSAFTSTDTDPVDHKGQSNSAEHHLHR